MPFTLDLTRLSGADRQAAVSASGSGFLRGGAKAFTEERNVPQPGHSAAMTRLVAMI